MDYSSILKSALNRIYKPEIATRAIEGTPNIVDVNSVQAEAQGVGMDAAYNALNKSNRQNVTGTELGQSVGAAAGLGQQGQNFAGMLANNGVMAAALVRPSPKNIVNAEEKIGKVITKEGGRVLSEAEHAIKADASALYNKFGADGLKAIMNKNPEALQMAKKEGFGRMIQRFSQGLADKTK